MCCKYEYVVVFTNEGLLSAWSAFEKITERVCYFFAEYETKETTRKCYRSTYDDICIYGEISIFNDKRIRTGTTITVLMTACPCYYTDHMWN